MLPVFSENQIFIIQPLKWSLKPPKCKKTNAEMVPTLFSLFLENSWFKLNPYCKWVFIHLKSLSVMRKLPNTLWSSSMKPLATKLRMLETTMKCSDAWKPPLLLNNTVLKTSLVAWSPKLANMLSQPALVNSLPITLESKRFLEEVSKCPKLFKVWLSLDNPRLLFTKLPTARSQCSTLTLKWTKERLKVLFFWAQLTN